VPIKASCSPTLKRPRRLEAEVAMSPQLPTYRQRASWPRPGSTGRCESLSSWPVVLDASAMVGLVLRSAQGRWLLSRRRASVGATDRAMMRGRKAGDPPDKSPESCDLLFQRDRARTSQAALDSGGCAGRFLL
jgi:hypothetical protein